MFLNVGERGFVILPPVYWVITCPFTSFRELLFSYRACMCDKFGVLVSSQVLLTSFSVFYVYICCKSPVQLNNG